MRNGCSVRVGTKQLKAGGETGIEHLSNTS